MIFGRYNLIHATDFPDETSLFFSVTGGSDPSGTTFWVEFHESSILAVITRMSGPTEWSPGEKGLPSWLRVIGRADPDALIILSVSRLYKDGVTSMTSYQIGHFGDTTFFASVTPAVFRERCPYFKLLPIGAIRHF